MWRRFGIFAASRRLERQGPLTGEENRAREETVAWIKEHLPEPPFYAEGNPQKAITYFKEDHDRPHDREAADCRNAWKLCSARRIRECPRSTGLAVNTQPGALFGVRLDLCHPHAQISIHHFYLAAAYDAPVCLEHDWVTQ